MRSTSSAPARSTLFASTALLLSAACAPSVASHPPVFAFGAIQCQPVRQVACLRGPVLTDERCQELIPPAIADLNAAVGHPIFNYMGTVSAAEARQAIEGGVYVILATETDGNTLGVTRMYEKGHCVETGFTVLSARMLQGEYTGVFPQAVLEHEMLHELGAGHADGATRSFGSIMAAGTTDTNYSPHLTDLDKDTLSRVYR